LQALSLEHRTARIELHRDANMSETAPTHSATATRRKSDASAPRAPAIETDRLSRAVVGKVLVDDVSVQVRTGEVMAVVGPSGAGKSSFLRLLNRLDEPTGGTVRLDGRDYRELTPRDLRRRVGMVMQSAFLFPGTVGANVAFGPLQRGDALLPDQIEALLERVGLAGYQARDVSNLSGGEAQRVSLARTMANAPETLLLDEPTSALDEISARRIEDLVLDIIRDRRMTCVIVTHNTAQAHRVADRTMILEAGRLAAVGPTNEVLHDR
jgi:ABC-type sulfate/molybdate transport systems ATPase subunit